MDEPFGALDPLTRDELQREFLSAPAEDAQDGGFRDPRLERSVAVGISHCADGSGKAGHGSRTTGICEIDGSVGGGLCKGVW